MNGVRQGWAYQRRDRTASIIVSCSEHDGVEWLHASIACPDRTPDYDDLRLLWEAVFGDGWAYQVFAPTAEHVNIHEHACTCGGGRTAGRYCPCSPWTARSNHAVTVGNIVYDRCLVCR